MTKTLTNASHFDLLSKMKTGRTYKVDLCAIVGVFNR